MSVDLIGLKVRINLIISLQWRKLRLLFFLVFLILTIRAFILNIPMFFKTVSAGQQINVICLDPNWNILKLHLFPSSNYITSFCETKSFGLYSWTKRRLISDTPNRPEIYKSSYQIFYLKPFLTSQDFLKVWQPRCVAYVRNNTGLICRYTTFVKANPLPPKYVAALNLL